MLIVRTGEVVVRFVGIGRIVSHHCFNFHFHNLGSVVELVIKLII
jgi:hypothetical protein